MTPDKQALRYGDNVLWFLNELAAYDANDIDGGEFDVYGEDRNGLEGCSTIDVTELATDAAKLIEAAEKRIAELTSMEDEQLIYQERRYQFVGKRQLEYWADVDRSTFQHLPKSERRIICIKGQED